MCVCVRCLFHAHAHARLTVSHIPFISGVLHPFGHRHRPLQFFDLLDANAASASAAKLQARNYGPEHGGFVVEGVTRTPLRSPAAIFDIITRGAKARSVGATASNDRSSRSHAILTVHVDAFDAVRQVRTRGKLQLIDLAGSESVAKSQAQGERLKEAANINSSLSHLASVFDAIARKAAHVPYRNSQLTQYLQDSLSGQARVLMLLHVAPTTQVHALCDTEQSMSVDARFHFFIFSCFISPRPRSIHPLFPPPAVVG